VRDALKWRVSGLELLERCACLMFGESLTHRQEQKSVSDVRIANDGGGLADGESGGSYSVRSFGRCAARRPSLSGGPAVRLSAVQSSGVRNAESG
jgi:hypothetical protein